MDKRVVCIASSTGDAIPLPGDGTNGLGVQVKTTTSQAITSVSGTKADSGDNTLISTPGTGKRIVLLAILIQNESATATTFILKDGSTAFARMLAQNQGDGLCRVYLPDARKKLSENAALVLNLSGANSHGYSVDYYTEDV